MKKAASPDPRNLDIQVWVGDGLVHRDQARVSVFDSVVQGGDAVWEGLRIYQGHIGAFDAHLDRLFASARAMAFDQVPDRDWIAAAVFATLEANGMTDGVHIRLTLTRGSKITSGMNPRLNQSGPCLIVLAEWKPPVYPEPLTLVTSAIRRNSPQFVDSKIHHNNLINNILAVIQANVAGADAALMLDDNGFVSETNDTNIFMVREAGLFTPFADACLPGITRALVLKIAAQEGIRCEEKNLSLVDFYTADEAFTTGTMGELTAVRRIDGRSIGETVPGPLTRKLQKIHRQWILRDATPLPFV
ncbi:branched-chain-amino-acid aminotransferase [bacterium MnTg04]|nr:branched-chain-amino-acid aminotransferase [bacterium MnTg04]